MTVNRLLLIGGGGHCLSCLDVIRLTGQYHIVGIIDRILKPGDQVNGVPVVGNDDGIEYWLDQVDQVLITLGMVDRDSKRMELYQWLSELGADFARVISPRAYVSADADIGKGCIVMHDALVNSGVRIGDNCVINTKALIEHGTRVGNHCHISTRATLNGDVGVADNVLVGSHAVVFPGCQIGANAVIGGGQVIRNSVNPGYHPNQDKSQDKK
ncbi:MAG: acetyltransferase [Gammaproteobacteria bacterium]|nr:acetyltransferase [Gammaproteobacteria bacterium]